MTDWPHDTLVQMLSERPGDLDVLLALSRGKPAPTTSIAWTVQDSVLRPTPAVEVRPDLVWVAPDGDWTVLEVQRAIDAEKSRRWPLAAALMLDTHKRMGDVVVLTASPHVARWARSVAVHTGLCGTRFSVVPTVVLLHGPWVSTLLNPARPELGFYAAWAMHERHGPEAKRVVTRALALADALPPELKRAQKRAILAVLGKAMLAWLKEASMNASKIIEPPEVTQFVHELEARGEARGKAEGKAEALLTILSARGLAISDAQRAVVLGCADAETLNRWLYAAVTASDVGDLLAG